MSRFWKSIHHLLECIYRICIRRKRIAHARSDHCVVQVSSLAPYPLPNTAQVVRILLEDNSRDLTAAVFRHSKTSEMSQCWFDVMVDPRGWTVSKIHTLEFALMAAWRVLTKEQIQTGTRLKLRVGILLWQCVIVYMPERCLCMYIELHCKDLVSLSIHL